MYHLVTNCQLIIYVPIQAFCIKPVTIGRIRLYGKKTPMSRDKGSRNAPRYAKQGSVLFFVALDLATLALDQGRILVDPQQSSVRDNTLGTRSQRLL